MKIKLISDVHLEFGYYDVPQDGADVLVIAGDLLVVEDLHDISPETQAFRLKEHLMSTRLLQVEEFRDFLAQVSQKFKHVVYVMGNHEFYGGRFFGSIEHLKFELEQYPNIHLLEQSAVVIDGITFIGGTMWTDFNRRDPLSVYDAKLMMNDYKTIRFDKNGYRKLRPEDTLNRHIQTVHYFQNKLKETTGPVVMVTHHAPSFQSIPSRFRDMPSLNGSYASDLQDLILEFSNIQYWFHGHIHDALDYKVGDCRVVCNPRGYFFHNGYENTNFNNHLVLEI
jgi:Icc-related predicted phosphoesterase